MRIINEGVIPRPIEVFALCVCGNCDTSFLAEKNEFSNTVHQGTYYTDVPFRTYKINCPLCARTMRIDQARMDMAVRAAETFLDFVHDDDKDEFIAGLERF